MIEVLNSVIFQVLTTMVKQLSIVGSRTWVSRRPLGLDDKPTVRTPICSLYCKKMKRTAFICMIWVRWTRANDQTLSWIRTRRWCTTCEEKSIWLDLKDKRRSQAWVQRRQMLPLDLDLKPQRQGRQGRHQQRRLNLGKIFGKKNERTMRTIY